MKKFIGYIPVAFILIVLFTQIGEELEARIADLGLWLFGVILFSGIFFLGYFSRKIGEQLFGKDDETIS